MNSWSSGSKTLAEVSSLGSSRLSHLSAYKCACPDGKPRGD